MKVRLEQVRLFYLGFWVLKKPWGTPPSSDPRLI